MSSGSEFTELLGRVRSGDQSAAQELVGRYGKVLRRTLSLRLQNTALQRVVDAEDVCQSVFKSFFFRAALGQFELESSNDLVNLLLRMAHNKLTEQKRKQEADCRDIRRVGGDAAELPVAQPGPTPSQQLSVEELLREAQRRFTDEEKQILALREQGLEWAAIAGQLGGTLEGRRKQWERARERVAQELGLEE
jgi:RNA polymerase sigma-70 factor (ECF subfamily)